MSKIHEVGVLAILLYPGPVFAQLNWSPPVAVDSAASSDSRHDTSPQLATGPDNALVLGWVSQSYSGTTSITETRHSDIFARYSLDGTETWSDVQSLSNSDYYSGSLDLASGGPGEFYFAWCSGDLFSRYRLHTVATLDHGATYADQVTTQPFTSGQMGFLAPQISKAGGVNVLFKSSWNTNVEFDPIDGYIWTQPAVGETWVESGVVALPAPSHFYKIVSADVASDGSHAVGLFSCLFDVGSQDYRYRLLAMTSSDSGNNWISSGYITPEDLETGEEAALKNDGQGVWVSVCALRDSSDGAEHVITLRSLDNGLTWSAPVAIMPPPNTIDVVDSPALATDGNGNWVCVFEGFEDATTNGYKDDGEIFYSLSTDSGATWSSAKAINPFPADDAAVDVKPAITYVGGGKWLVAWSRRDSGAENDIVISTTTVDSMVKDWQLF